MERDEARAEGFAEAALAVEQGLEIDRLRKRCLLLLGGLMSEQHSLLWVVDQLAHSKVAAPMR